MNDSEGPSRADAIKWLGILAVIGVLAGAISWAVWHDSEASVQKQQADMDKWSGRVKEKEAFDRERQERMRASKAEADRRISRMELLGKLSPPEQDRLRLQWLQEDMEAMQAKAERK